LDIDRAIPAKALDAFVSALAERIAALPAGGLAMVKARVDAITLAAAADFRRDSELFLEATRDAETQRRIGAAMQRGFQTRDGEMDLDRMVTALGQR